MKQLPLLALLLVQACEEKQARETIFTPRANKLQNAIPSSDTLEKKEEQAEQTAAEENNSGFIYLGAYLSDSLMMDSLPYPKAQPVLVYKRAGEELGESVRLFIYEGLEDRFHISVISDNYTMSANDEELEMRDTTKLPFWPKAAKDDDFERSYLIVNGRYYKISAAVVPYEIALVRSGAQEYLACLFQNANANGTTARLSWGHFIRVSGKKPLHDYKIEDSYLSLNLLQDFNNDGFLDLPVMKEAPCKACNLPDTCGKNFWNLSCAYLELQSLYPKGWRKAKKNSILLTALYDNQSYPEIKPLFKNIARH